MRALWNHYGLPRTPSGQTPAPPASPETLAKLDNSACGARFCETSVQSDSAESGPIPINTEFAEGFLCRGRLQYGSRPDAFSYWLIASVFAAPPGPVFPAPEASRIKGFGYAAVTEEIFALRCPSGPERVLTFFFFEPDFW